MSDIGSGDKLARGAHSAQFTLPTGVSDDKWAEIFQDFDPEVYRRNADAEKAGNVGAVLGEDRPEPVREITRR